LSLAIEIVTDFAIIMTIAAVATFIFYKLKQPLILGYLIAGIIIGPYVPPFSLVTRIFYFSSLLDCSFLYPDLEL
jgi:Kef-type K+ transport system membrane component KefB